ncbi:hypothetical protein NP233_g12618 [Leucocoprinus birnbaumii]|uniref:Uncharacterized protein n=1 Tax=Leucocoprinus birnbaumii TaxID=56174 RepID=A0AAD5VE40_9AGAR|nr:hypothetical protein NP233_g12618 [Leucocoprinus birnbaumii]
MSIARAHNAEMNGAAFVGKPKMKWFTVTRGSGLGVFSDLNLAAACAGPEDGKIHLFNNKGDTAIKFYDAFSRNELEKYYGGKYYPVGVSHFCFHPKELKDN